VEGRKAAFACWPRCHSCPLLERIAPHHFSILAPYYLPLYPFTAYSFSPYSLMLITSLLPTFHLPPYSLVLLSLLLPTSLLPTSPPFLQTYPPAIAAVGRWLAVRCLAQ